MDQKSENAATSEALEPRYLSLFFEFEALSLAIIRLKKKTLDQGLQAIRFMTFNQRFTSKREFQSNGCGFLRFIHQQQQQHVKDHMQIRTEQLNFGEMWLYLACIIQCLSTGNKMSLLIQVKLQLRIHPAGCQYFICLIDQKVNKCIFQYVNQFLSYTQLGLDDA